MRAAAADTAVVTASSHWPEPGSPYAKLIEAERHATRLTYIGAIPGVLLDMEAVADRDATRGLDPVTRPRNHRLLVCRQELSQARLATGELETTLFLGRGFLTAMDQATPQRAAAQAEQLLEAIDAGWDIRVAPTECLELALPPHTYNIVLAGDPAAPDGVYWEAADSSMEPHETWHADGWPIGRAARIYTAVSAMALDAASSRTLIEAQR